MVLSELHATPIAVHFGFTKTYDRVKHSFFWEGMKQDVHNFVAKCDVCQRNKGETIKSLGTLQLYSDSTCYLVGYLYGVYYRLT